MSRALAVAALTVYAALLVLSAWPPGAGAGAVEGAARASRALLGRVGIRGGIAVFEAPRERIVRALRNDCIRIRTVAADGSRTLRHPPGGECFVQGVRLRVPTQERVVRSLLVRAPTPLGQAVVSDRFCAAGDAPPVAVEALWTQHWLDLEDGAEGESGVAIWRWHCRPPALVSETRRPGATAIRAWREAGGAP